MHEDNESITLDLHFQINKPHHATSPNTNVRFISESNDEQTPPTIGIYGAKVKSAHLSALISATMIVKDIHC